MTTILQRDVRDLSNIEGWTALPYLLSLIATRSGVSNRLYSALVHQPRKTFGQISSFIPQ